MPQAVSNRFTALETRQRCGKGVPSQLMAFPFSFRHELQSIRRDREHEGLAVDSQFALEGLV